MTAAFLPTCCAEPQGKGGNGDEQKSAKDPFDDSQLRFCFRPRSCCVEAPRFRGLKLRRKLRWWRRNKEGQPISHRRHRSIKLRRCLPSKWQHWLRSSITHRKTFRRGSKP